MNITILNRLHGLAVVVQRLFRPGRIAAVSAGVLAGTLIVPAVAFAQETPMEKMQQAIDMVWVVMAPDLHLSRLASPEPRMLPTSWRKT